MSSSDSPRAGCISLEELTALNDEIASLVRAGVPLEHGLGCLAGDMPGRLGEVAARIAQRIEQGEPLDRVLADPTMRIPPVYRAVVEAGLRSGRLPSALESVARSTRWLTECRRMVIGSFVYPLLLFLLGWTFLVFFVLKIAPGLAKSMGDFGALGSDVMATVAGWGRSAEYWGPAVPLAVLVLIGAWWFLSARASLVQPYSAGMALGWIPWMRGVLKSLRMATFTEVLATLVENQVPLPESLELAGETSGDRQTVEASRRLADAVRRGEPVAAGERWVGHRLPPLVRWLLAAGEQRGALLTALRQAAETYRRRAERQAEMARLYVPVLATVLVGGAMVTVEATLVFGSWASLLKALVGIALR
ncbi:MAG: type II secretion system F family protein [Pirellulales bacterium]|nr:type II secretion system F family protein [Pirellulales bacterium]